MTNNIWEQLGINALHSILNEKAKNTQKKESVPDKPKIAEKPKKKEPVPEKSIEKKPEVKPEIDKPTSREQKKEISSEKASKIVKVQTGGGWSKASQLVKGRMVSDPRGLMKDMGITNSFSGTDIDQAIAIMQTAIRKNDVMSDAYKSIRKTMQDTDEAGILSVRELGINDGIRFAAFTLQAAINAGFFNPDKQVAAGKNANGYVVLRHV